MPSTRSKPASKPVTHPHKYDRARGGLTLADGWSRDSVKCDTYSVEGKLGNYRVILPHTDGDEYGPNVLQVQLHGEHYYRHVYTFECGRNLEWVAHYINACDKAGKIITVWAEQFQHLPLGSS